MPITSRVFRVFVSSTFQDLQEERNLLQREVFPRLREFCAARGARFQAIDLRWGVRDEAALDQRTLEICLTEIERCKRTGVKPNFLTLLGDRYGWIPLPFRIPVTELECLLSHVPDDARRALLREWYPRDDNASPAEHRLRPRTGVFVVPEEWDSVERQLRGILADAVDRAGLSGEQRTRYVASATHQEILCGLGRSEEDWKHVFAFFRVSDNPPDPELEQLKAFLRERLRGNVTNYRSGDLDALCHSAYTRLASVIEWELARLDERSQVSIEAEEHTRFAEERCRVFVGRASVLASIDDYLSGKGSEPLVLTGPSGSGKSAVMARASLACSGRGRVIRRFVGATPLSTVGRSLLTDLCRELGAVDTPVEFGDLVEVFKDRLWQVDVSRALILFVDAIDQLPVGDPARVATWLPAELPRHVRIVVSTTAETGPVLSGVQLSLDPMSIADAADTLAQRLQLSGRTLCEWQRQLVLEQFSRCGSALYLTLAADEVRLWCSDDPPERCRLGDGVPGILDTVMTRLSAPNEHGRTLPGRALGYLAASRDGLAEDELLDVLAGDDVVWSDFENNARHPVDGRRLPVVVWSRLSLDLQAYLVERNVPGGTVLNFYHQQVADHVRRRFLGTPSEAQNRRESLERYFQSQSCFGESLEAQRARAAARPATPRPANRRRLTELPWLRTASAQVSGDWLEVVRLFENLEFLESKAEAGLLFDLLADFERVLLRMPLAHDHYAHLHRIHEALRRDARFVVQHPTLLFQCLWNRCWWFDSPETGGHFAPLDQETDSLPFWQHAGPMLYRIAEEWRKDKARRTPGFLWVRALRPPSVGLDRELLVLNNGGSFATRHLVFSSDDRYLLTLTEDRAAVWHLGYSLATSELHVRDTALLAGAFLPSGTPLAYGKQGGRLRAWDVSRREVVFDFDGSVEEVDCLSVTAHGGLLVGGCRTGALIVWDGRNGTRIAQWDGHNTPVECVAASEDHCTLASVASGVVRLWHPAGRLLRELPLGATSVAFSPTERELAVGAAGVVKLFDPDSGTCRMSLEGHAVDAPIRSLSYSADGETLASASFDMTIRVWSRRHSPTVLTGHSQTPEVVALSADGELVASGAWEEKVLVRRLSKERQSPMLHEHRSWITYVAASPTESAVGTRAGGQARIWDAASGRCSAVVEEVDGGPCFAGSDNIFAVSGEGRGLQIHSHPPGEVLVEIPMLWRPRLSSVQAKLSPSVEGTQTIACSPDGKILASSAAYGTVALFDWRRMVAIGAINEDPDAMAFSPDGQHLVCLDAVVGKAGRMRVAVYDVASCAAERVLMCDGCQFASRVAFSADSRYVVFPGSLGVGIWDWQAGEIRWQDGLTLAECSMLRREFLENEAAPGGAVSFASRPGDCETLWLDSDGETVAAYPGRVDVALVTNDGLVVGVDAHRLELLRFEVERG